jgi:NAD(P)-dependent dehydrogenase (short-subunit alcohol dehydrogenase family)
MSIVEYARALFAIIVAPFLSAFLGFFFAVQRFFYILARDWNGWNKPILLKDQVIIVTGAAGGFGTVVSKSLVNAGAIVYAIDVVEPSAAEEILPRSDRCIYKKLDITDNKALEKFVNELRKKNVQVYAVLNNAGITGTPTAATQCGPENLQKVLGVNFFAAAELTRLLFDINNPLFKFSSQKCVAGRAPTRSRVVNVTSVAGVLSAGGLAPYCASKFALEAWSDGTRIETSDKYIDVALVEPYFAVSGIYRTLLDEKTSFENSILKENQEKARAKFSKALANNQLMSAEYVASFIIRALTEAVPQDRYMVAPLEVEAGIRFMIHAPNYFHMVDKMKKTLSNGDRV